MLLGSALSAFQTAAGISPAKISFLIRTVIFGGSLLWGGWCVHGEIHRMRHQEVSEKEFTIKLFRVFFVVTIIWALVFIV